MSELKEFVWPKHIRGEAVVSIGKRENGATSIKINGIEVSQLVSRFSVDQSGVESLPMIRLYIPATLEMDLKALLDIEIR